MQACQEQHQVDHHWLIATDLQIVAEADDQLGEKPRDVHDEPSDFFGSSTSKQIFVKRPSPGDIKSGFVSCVIGLMVTMLAWLCCRFNLSTLTGPFFSGIRHHAQENPYKSMD